MARLSLGFARKTAREPYMQEFEQQTNELDVLELDSIFARSLFTACKYFVRIQLVPIGCEMFQAWRHFDLPTAMWLVGLCLGYGVFLLVASEAMLATLKIARITCGMAHAAMFVGLFGAIFSDEDDLVMKSELLARGPIIMAVVFPNRDFFFLISGLCLIGCLMSTAITCGYDALSLWFWTQKTFHF